MKGAKPTLRVVNGGLVDAPPPPSTLPEGVHDVWNITVKDLADRKLLTETALGPVENYCLATWMMRTCQEALKTHGLIVFSKDKVPKANPAGAMFSKAQETAARLSVELGLTPSARSRKGLSGASSENDDMDDIGA